MKIKISKKNQDKNIKTTIEDYIIEIKNKNNKKISNKNNQDDIKIKDNDDNDNDNTNSIKESQKKDINNDKLVDNKIFYNNEYGNIVNIRRNSPRQCKMEKIDRNANDLQKKEELIQKKNNEVNYESKDENISIKENKKEQKFFPNKIYKDFINFNDSSFYFIYTFIIITIENKILNKSNELESYLQFSLLDKQSKIYLEKDEAFQNWNFIINKFENNKIYQKQYSKAGESDSNTHNNINNKNDTNNNSNYKNNNNNYSDKDNTNNISNNNNDNYDPNEKSSDNNSNNNNNINNNNNNNNNK